MHPAGLKRRREVALERARVRKKLVYTSICISATLTCIVVVLEAAIRLLVIPRNFSVYHVTRGQFPFYRLVESYESRTTTIKKGRRERALRGDRSLRIAVVGDSVAYGGGVSDEDSLCELLQNRQQVFDVYNYGVPGYGLLEVKSVISELLVEHWDAVVYIYNFNDLHPAMAGWLSLLKNSKNRLTSIYHYDPEPYGRLKGFIADHFKSALVLKPEIENILTRALTRETDTTNLDAGNGILVQQPQKSYADIKRLAKRRSFQRSFTIWKRIYADEQMLEKVSRLGPRRNCMWL